MGFEVNEEDKKSTFVILPAYNEATRITPVIESIAKKGYKMVIVNDGSLSASVEKIYDAVMMIQNYQNNAIASTGSGFVYKTDDKYGYVLTNHHVISGATKIVLIRSDDKEIEGTVLGSDEYLDLAVVRINGAL